MRYLLSLFILLFSVSIFADETQCATGQEMISAVGHSLCATVTSKNNIYNFSMPAGAGSALDKMHVTFGPKIYAAYVQGVKMRKIPVGVAHLIHFVHYQNNVYVCKKLVVTKNAVLNMTNCPMQVNPKIS